MIIKAKFDHNLPIFSSSFSIFLELREKRRTLTKPTAFDIQALY